MSESIKDESAPLSGEEQKIVELFKISKHVPGFRVKLLRNLIAQDPVLAKDLRKILGVSKKQETPYYNRASALVMKQLVDDMIADHCSRELFFADFPEHAPTSVRQRIFGGLKYLIDEMDEDGKYSVWRNNVEVQIIRTKEEGEIGIRIVEIEEDSERKLNFFLRNIRVLPKEVKALRGENVVMQPSMKSNEWKEIITEFIESEHSDVTLSDLNLSQMDKEWLQNLFAATDEFVVRVTTKKIKIIRGMPEEEERIKIE